MSAPKQIDCVVLDCGLVGTDHEHSLTDQIRVEAAWCDDDTACDGDVLAAIADKIDAEFERLRAAAEGQQ
jgi:hypothetical protein